jgi:mannose-6-phosphate isomerase
LSNSETISIQVHPDDDYALEHDDSLGKTEMWYIMPSPEDASIYLGWNQDTNEALVRAALEDGTLARYMRDYKVQAGDAVLIPAGTVHAMRRNTILAEIQENSDATYRLYDYNRLGDDGKLRPLHVEKSLDVLDYAAKQNAVHHPMPVMNGAVNVEDTDFFTVNLLTLNKAVQRDYAPLDSFVAYMCVEGACEVTALDCESEDKTVAFRKGEAVLVPACLNDIVLTPQPETKLLEIYIR